jgi:putative phosphoesterase
MAIGVISDTHGLLRTEVKNALQGSDLILHAGDVGSAEVLRDLRCIAPVVVVRGNVDTAPWARSLRLQEIADFDKKTTSYILHRIADLDLKPKIAGFDAVIFGHSHQPTIEWRDGVLFFNPGSAGPAAIFTAGDRR